MSYDGHLADRKAGRARRRGRDEAAAVVKTAYGSIDGPVVYDVPEVMRRLGITRPTLYIFLRSGELRSFRLGTRRLVSAEALAEFIRLREVAEAG